MSSQEVMLTWSGHHRTLISVFERLLEKNSLVDCTLAAGGQRLTAHKEVLSAFSPYFEMLFQEENEKNPTILLSGFLFEDVQCIIDFIYQGKVTISEGKVEDLMAAAQCLQIKGLGGGQKEEDNETDYLHSRDAQSHLTRKRKRKCDEFASVAYEDQCGSAGRNSFQNSLHHQVPVDAFPSSDLKSTSSLQNQVPDINVDEQERLSARHYPLSHDCEDQVLDPALIVKIEFNSANEIPPMNECSITSSTKCEENMERNASNSSRSSYGRGAETKFQLSSEGSVCNSDKFSSVPATQNRCLSSDVIVKAEPNLENVNVSEEEMGISSVLEEIGNGHINKTSLIPGTSSYRANAPEAYGSPMKQTYRPMEVSNRGRGPVDWTAGPVASSSAIGSTGEQMQRRIPGRRPPREYTCPECHKVFRQSCNLKVHLRIHTGERPYKCNECDFAATHVSNLKQHQRIHSGERPYKCNFNECNFAAAGSGDLKKHQRIHTGEKPFKCPDCDFATAGNGDLHKHMRLHGKDRPLDNSNFDCSVPGTSDLIHSIPKYFENNYLLKMSNL